MPASYDQDKEKALKSVTFWKGAMIKAFFKADIHDPREIQENGQVVGNDIMEQMGYVISNAEEGIKKIKKYTVCSLSLENLKHFYCMTICFSATLPQI